MTMMLQSMVEDKAGLDGQLSALRQLVEAAVGTGRAAHEVEQELFRGVLQLGHALLGYFFEQSGAGDAGERLELTDGRVLKRFGSTHDRTYHSVFGDFRLSRWVYGRREGQRIECVPLDTRLRLPESSCSYLLQDWTQALVVEMAYEQAQAVLERVLGGQSTGVTDGAGKSGNGRNGAGLLGSHPEQAGRVGAVRGGHGRRQRRTDAKTS